MVSLTGLWPDLRQTVRTLRRSPGFTATAVLTLALGLGASTALFTVVRGILLTPLPYRDAGRLAVIIAEQDYEGIGRPVRASWPPAAVAAWPSPTSTIERIGFYGEGGAAVDGPQTSELVDVSYVSGTFFDTVGGDVTMGRALGPSDDRQPSVVVSARLWRRLFADAPDWRERSITLSGQTLTIVGVAADSFQVPTPRTNVWIPAGWARMRNPSDSGYTAIVRLRPGVTTTAATAEIASITRALAVDSPRQLDGVRVRAEALHDLIVSGARPALLVLTGATGLLLLLACANVMNLVLARNSARPHETAIRRALGASRGRLVAHGLTASALIAAAGTAAGVALAAFALRALKAWPPVGLPRLDAVEIDGTVLLFACAVAAASTVAVGLVPALQGGDMTAAVKASQPGSLGTRRTRGALRVAIVAQLAISVVLLVGAVLLGRSLVALMRTDIGVTPEQVATASLNLTMDRKLTDRQQIDLVDRIIARIGALPMVSAAGVGAARPPDASRMRVTLNRTGDPDARASFMATAVPVTPGYFRALDVSLERGRFFTEADDGLAPPVVIMSTDTARVLFGEQDPIGRTIALPVLKDGKTGKADMTVVGITASVKYSGLDRVAEAVVYRPFAQQAWRSVFLVARTAGDPGALASSLQREIAAVDRGVTVSDVTTLSAVLADATSQPRFRTLLLSAFALMATAIAAVGLYGVMAFAVSQRAREIGVRMALGADGRHIRRMVLREGLMLALLGGAIGLAGAYAMARVLTTMLHGIASTDPVSFALATAGLIAIGLAASYIPAVRAARADPLVVLKAG